MMEEREDYQKILDEAVKYFKEKPEKNIFSIGGRGYYAGYM
jgi:hypothetical protein